MITIRIQTENELIPSNQIVKNCWIDARNITREDQIRLEQEFNIASDLLSDIMDIDEQARIEKEDEYTAIIIRVPVYDEQYDVSYFTVPVGVILFADKIITICQRSSDVLDDLASNRVRTLDITNKSTFVLNLLGRAALSYLRGLKDLNKTDHNNRARTPEISQE